MVKKADPKENFYFTTTDLIHKGKSLKQVADNLGISKQNLNYHIYPLKVYKVIKPIGKGVWEVNKDNFRKFLEEKMVKKPHPDTQDKAEIRGHAFVFTVKLPKIDNWHRRKIFFEKKDFHPDEKVKNRIGIHLKLDKHLFRLWLCKKTIVIYFPNGKDYFDSKAKNTYLMAVYDLKRILTRLENVLGTTLRINENWHFRASRKHFSLLKNELANKYRKENKKLYISDIDGVWLLADYSFNVDELEVIRNTKEDKSENLTDNIIVPFFNSLKEKPFTATDFSDVKEVVTNLVQLQKVNQQLQENNQILISKIIKKIEG